MVSFDCEVYLSRIILLLMSTQSDELAMHQSLLELVRHPGAAIQAHSDGLPVTPSVGHDFVDLNTLHSWNNPQIPIQ